MRIIAVALLALFLCACEWKPENACEKMVVTCSYRCENSVATADLGPCFMACATSYAVCTQAPNSPKCEACPQLSCVKLEVESDADLTF